MSSYQQVHGDGAKPASGSTSDSYYSADRQRISIDEEAGQADLTYKNDGICGPSHCSPRHRNTRLMALVGAAILIIIITIVIVARGRGSDPAPVSPRNVILLIPDGTGVASLTMARVCKGSSLTLDSILKGSIRTYSSNSLVTDSAASATAYASGEKTFNGAIGVDRNEQKIGTLHEAAKRQGMVAGLVATSRITHATPAAFSSHVKERDGEEDIAAQQVTKKLDFAFGGGAKYFMSNRRTDKRDLVGNLTAQGYTVVLDRASFDTWATKATSGKSAFPVYGLLADSHLEYEIDRVHGVSDQPSLTQIVAPLLSQLELVAKPGGRGFIAMIEGSRVDHAGHANDPATHMREALEFDATVALALQFREKYPETLVISVADHETGGLTLGRDGVYDWFPEALIRVNKSTASLTALLQAGEPIDSTIAHWTGMDITDGEHTELDLLINGTTPIDPPKTRDVAIGDALGHMISKRAGVQWTTGGHTGVDIGLYAAGPADWAPTAVHENTDINKVIASYLSLDLAAVTRELRGL